jgi:hypothetical protein
MFSNNAMQCNAMIQQRAFKPLFGVNVYKYLQQTTNIYFIKYKMESNGKWLVPPPPLTATLFIIYILYINTTINHATNTHSLHYFSNRVHVLRLAGVLCNGFKGIKGRVCGALARAFPLRVSPAQR